MSFEFHFGPVLSLNFFHSLHSSVYCTKNIFSVFTQRKSFFRVVDFQVAIAKTLFVFVHVETEQKRFNISYKLKIITAGVDAMHNMKKGKLFVLIVHFLLQRFLMS